MRERCILNVYIYIYIYILIYIYIYTYTDIQYIYIYTLQKWNMAMENTFCRSSQIPFFNEKGGTCPGLIRLATKESWQLRMFYHQWPMDTNGNVKKWFLKLPLIPLIECRTYLNNLKNRRVRYSRQYDYGPLDWVWRNPDPGSDDWIFLGSTWINTRSHTAAPCQVGEIPKRYSPALCHICQASMAETQVPRPLDYQTCGRTPVEPTFAALEVLGT